MSRCRISSLFARWRTTLSWIFQRNSAYILVQEADFDKAIEALQNAGYPMLIASEEQTTEEMS